ncbi:MAG: hypothetical protein GY928_02570, partial [Colwellia sp.]|nr:hypothetical protein [Colwellia sp.]
TTYENNGATIEQCNDFVVMTSTQYNNIKGEVFDPAAYEIGLYGILKFFTAGIGIGAILALVSKLRR